MHDAASISRSAGAVLRGALLGKGARQAALAILTVGFLAAPASAQINLSGGGGGAQVPQATPVYTGDYDGNGIIDTGDSFLISEAIDGEAPVNVPLGDVTQDGILDETDALRVLRYHHRAHGVLGFEHFLPPAPPAHPQIEYIVPPYGVPGDPIEVRGREFFTLYYKATGLSPEDLVGVVDPMLVKFAQATVSVSVDGVAIPIVGAHVTMVTHDDGTTTPQEVLDVILPMNVDTGHLRVDNGVAPSTGLTFIVGPTGSRPVDLVFTTTTPGVTLASSQAVDPLDWPNWFEAGVITFSVLAPAKTTFDGLVVNILGDHDTTADVSGAPGYLPTHGIDVTSLKPGDTFDLGVWMRMPPETGASPAGTDFYVWFDPKAMDFVELHQGSYDWGFDYIPGTCIDVTYGRVSGARYDQN